MEDLSYIYHLEQEFCASILESPSLKRIRHVGMNCGLEYTSFPLFQTIQPYSRYQHSLGVSLIVYHFTHDLKQALAGLFHDIATPTFAHVVDFLNKDYLKQESTEENTKQMIEQDSLLMHYLNEHHISIDEVCDYHIYSIADNDSPKLSADRLEYTLGNAFNYHFATKDTIELIYNDLTIGKNEYGEDEMMFQTKQIAYAFTKLALHCSKVYVADFDRYSMEYLARLLKEAIELKVLEYSDLYTTEEIVIQKLIQHPLLKEKWLYLTQMNDIIVSNIPKDGYFKINAKKRYIDPYIVGLGRVSEVYPDISNEIQLFTRNDFDYYIKGVVK